MTAKLMKECIELSQEIGVVDMNKPETVAQALRLIADGSSKSDHNIPKSTGIWLKYFAESVEAGLADHTRQDNDNPGEISMGIVNAVAIVCGFFALGLSTTKEAAKLNKNAFADVFRRNLESFDNPSLEDQSKEEKSKSIMGKFLSDISGGTVH